MKKNKLKILTTILALTIILLMGVIGGAQYASVTGTIYVQIGDEDPVSLDYGPGDNLFDIIEENFDIEYQNDPMWGHYITSIENLSSDSSSFISIFVNGDESTKGIDDIELVDGMTISFRLVEFY
jgi:hypothetical protein